MISEIFPEDKRRLNDLEIQLTELERGNPRVDAMDIRIGLEDMHQRLNLLDSLVLKEPKAKRDEYRRRVNHLRSTHSHLSNSLESINKRSGNTTSLRSRLFGKQYSQEREELGAVNARDYESQLEVDMEMGNSLDRSNSMLSDYLNTGQETLAELVSQRERLKGVKGMVFSLMNTLGVSAQVMDAITYIQQRDGYVAYGGMALITVIFLWLVLRKLW